ncbi:hypothetical protein GWK08_05150 [Leptobacterium flavescens]|uniref:Uncharacterized protein n=1 Tax=Leptobacterium flavescens TaxID=472055 RepID=A0A6P0UQX6_9FLAO|nr:hypothetical protein [Leptobacterium flavescens]NER12816.1 hypothetical protein [Leptobacterium flavescens]
MKTYLNLLIFLVIAGTTSINAQSCPIPEPLDLKEAVGEWKGSFTHDGELKKFTVYISEEDGDLRSEISIPGITRDRITAFTKICSGEEIHVEIVVNNEKFDFRGKPKDGKMAGSVLYRNVKNDTSQEVFSLKRSR